MTGTMRQVFSRICAQTPAKVQYQKCYVVNFLKTRGIALFFCLFFIYFTFDLFVYASGPQFSILIFHCIQCGSYSTVFLSIGQSSVLFLFLFLVNSKKKVPILNFDNKILNRILNQFEDFWISI